MGRICYICRVDGHLASNCTELSYLSYKNKFKQSNQFYEISKYLDFLEDN